MMFDNEFSKQICKFGGPFILLICCSGVIWAFYALIKKETLAGNPLATKIAIEMVLFISVIIFGCLFFTYKSYEDEFKK